MKKLKVTDEFRLVETKSPDGRNNSKGQWKVEIDSENGIIVSLIENASKATVIDENIFIENEKGVENLPITGGMGSILYYVIGTTITIIALFSLTYNKREKNL